MTRACAPGKIILLGEHAVVYGRPALAIPVRQVQACARIEPAEGSQGQILINVPALGMSRWLDATARDDPLAAITRTTLLALQVSSFPPLRLTVESSIPVASGLGSSAAVSVAIARALNQHFGGALTTARISDLAYEVEKIHHGTPSGIDNTVVAHDRPVYFVRGREPEPLAIGASVRFLIGDTGIPAPTSQAVGLVRRRWEADPAALEAVFDAIAGLVTQARQALVDGQSAALGDFMNQNHRHLAGLGVSSPDLDRLVLAAGSTGALGAKMSGGGLGGNMVALVSPDRDEAVADALRRAGAVRVIQTEVTP